MEIKITSGGVIDNSDILHKHLVYNHLTNPDMKWDQLIQYAERRYLFTMLVSGVDSPFQSYKGQAPAKGDKSTIKTVIKPLPQGTGTDNKYWKFAVMGPVCRETVITKFIGTPTKGDTTRGGVFTAVAKDNTLKHQMNVQFPNGKYARIMREGRVQGDGGVILDFQCYPGDTFDKNTWMMGKSTVFGSFTTVGERSRMGYANFYTPDSYINHTTTQRKAFSISGDAAAQGIVWYELQGKKGFSYVAEKTVRQQFLFEDEDQKWNGISTMRDQFGNLLSNPSMYDEKGEPIIAGDGFNEQIRGFNEFVASDSDGLPSMDDISDMLNQLEQGRDNDDPTPWYCITGAAGMAKARKIGQQLNQQMNIQYHMELDPNSQTYGGQKIGTGYNIITLNINGKQVIFVENPTLNNLRKHPAVGPNGESVASATMTFMDKGHAGSQDNAVEIRTREGNGINRNLVYGWFDGMTGGPEKPLHPGDFKSFHMLKENMVCVYRPKANGIIRPNVSLW